MNSPLRTTLQQSNIAMENGPFEDEFPIKNGDIPASYVSLPEDKIKFKTLKVQEHGLKHIQKGQPHWTPKIQTLRLDASGDTITWLVNIVSLGAQGPTP